MGSQSLAYSFNGNLDGVDCQVSEFVGDSFRDLGITEDTVSVFREKYNGNCLTVAVELSRSLYMDGFLATVLTFKGKGHAFLNGLVVADELSGLSKIYTHHSVVMLGKYIVDLLHSDRLILTKEYIAKLEELNNGSIELIKPLSLWYDNNGNLFVPSIEYLKGYRS